MTIMDRYEALYSHNIYPVHISDYLRGYCNDRYLLYSPLAGVMAVADGSDVDRMNRELGEHGVIYGEEQAMLNYNPPRPNFVTDPHDVFALTILPNNICNFSCSYCYAARGHGHDELSDDTIRAVLDYFIDPERLSRRDLYISFGGGGEPLLSWPKMKLALEYSDALALKHGFTIRYSFASNGSVMNDEIINAIHRYNIKTNISFDILEDVQNAQRRNYERVCHTLDTLLAHDITPTINSVITPLNVVRQCEMVERVHDRFPGLRRLSFDYVVDGNLFEAVEELKKFYDTYIDNFFQAQKLGMQYGISVSSIKYHNLEQIKTRACAGGFDLTPQGRFSMCFFVSSPQELLYDDFIYGKVNGDGRLEFDREKFRDLVEASENRRDECRHCFIRWHCGGGCLYHMKSYTPEMLDVMCNFQRKFSLIALLNKAEYLDRQARCTET